MAKQRIQFRAGYASDFGDGNVVTSTLCQSCLKELLGPWLTIQVDDPFEPSIKLSVPRAPFNQGNFLLRNAPEHQR